MKKMQTGGEKKLSKLNQTGYLVPTGKSKTFKTAEEKKAAVQKMLKGSSKTTTKMQMGGAMGIVGMPKYSNDPRTDAGRTLKKGGSTKSTGCPPGYRDINGECVKAGILDGKSARIGVGTALTGMMGIGAKAIADKVRAKKAAKKAKETPKAKFGASVSVQHSPAPGRVRSSSGVGTVPVGMRKKKGGAVKKYQDGGDTSIAMQKISSKDPYEIAKKVNATKMLQSKKEASLKLAAAKNKLQKDTAKKYQDGGSKSKNAALDYDKQMLAKQQAENMKILSKEIRDKGTQEYNAKINQTRNNRANTDTLNEMYPNYQIGQKKKGGAVKMQKGGTISSKPKPKVSVVKNTKSYPLQGGFSTGNNPTRQIPRPKSIPQSTGQSTGQSKIKAMKSTGSKPMLKPIASGVAIANGPKPKPIKKAKKGGMVKGKKSC